MGSLLRTKPPRNWRTLEQEGRVGAYQLIQALPASRAARRYLGLSPEGLGVLVQVCHPELSGEPGFQRRFQREAEQYQALFGVLAWGRAHGLTYLVQPRPRGSSLRAALARAPLPDDLARAWAGDLVEALGEAHLRGVVHRHLNLDTIQVRRGRAAPVDFGLFSEACRFMWTPFTAPEQKEPQGAIGPWTDQYALGRVLCATWPDGPQQVFRKMTCPDPAGRYPHLETALQAL